MIKAVMITVFLCFVYTIYWNNIDAV